MKKRLIQQVTNSIFEVMETMFFLTVEEQQKSDPPLQAQPVSEEIKACSIKFSGSFSGTIFLEIPMELLKTMTENFMGQDLSPLSEEYMEGTLKEALNMIAGNTLTQIDKTSYMGLGIPDITTITSPEDVDETAIFNTENGTITAHIKLNEPEQ
ncbi:MAG: chemotaxis protein CheX [Desulfobacteraceae bacterium]|nr:chemotaxis protein CheX [Desulfobacteraceae bacterium]